MNLFKRKKQTKRHSSPIAPPNCPQLFLSLNDLTTHSKEGPAECDINHYSPKPLFTQSTKNINSTSLMDDILGSFDTMVLDNLDNSAYYQNDNNRFNDKPKSSVPPKINSNSNVYKSFKLGASGSTTTTTTTTDSSSTSNNSRNSSAYNYKPDKQQQPEVANSIKLLLEKSNVGDGHLDILRLIQMDAEMGKSFSEQGINASSYKKDIYESRHLQQTLNNKKITTTDQMTIAPKKYNRRAQKTASLYSEKSTDYTNYHRSPSLLNKLIINRQSTIPTPLGSSSTSDLHPQTNAEKWKKRSSHKNGSSSTPILLINPQQKKEAKIPVFNSQYARARNQRRLSNDSNSSSDSSEDLPLAIKQNMEVGMVRSQSMPSMGGGVGFVQVDPGVFAEMSQAQQQEFWVGYYRQSVVQQQQQVFLQQQQFLMQQQVQLQQRGGSRGKRG